MSLDWIRSRIPFRRQKLVVPARFNRNSATVTALMPAEESGAWLLERMRQHLDLDTYADKRMLDFGCGVRFSQAIVNKGLDLQSYLGVDNYREMIEFLQSSVRDRRLSFQFLDAHHALYNPRGKPLSPDMTLDGEEGSFDVVSMFSVITHQNPANSEAIFSLLRRYVAPQGALFFTCFLDPNIATFEDRSPERNGGVCFYNPDYLEAIVARCGWRKVRFAPSEGPIIANAFVFAPA